MSPYLTETQIEYFLTNELVRIWSYDNIASSLTLRAVSPKGYQYMREHMKLPYPSVSTLKRWTKVLTFKPGLLDIVLKLMKKKGDTMTAGERACILSFDEMNVTRAWEYVKCEDTVLSPHDYVQVAMLSGI